MNEWISVSNGLPKNREIVQVKYVKGNMERENVLEYYKGKWYWYNRVFEFKWGKITHWRYKS